MELGYCHQRVNALGGSCDASRFKIRDLKKFEKFGITKKRSARVLNENFDNFARKLQKINC